MPIAAADLTCLANLTGREISNRALRIIAPRLPSLNMAKCTGLGLVLPAILNGDASRAANLYRGIFEFSGYRVMLRGGSVFALREPRPASFDSTLHSFVLLHDLAAARGELYRVYARGLITEWLEERACQQVAARQIDTMAWRIINWIQCAPFLLSGASRSFEQTFLGSLTSQIRLLMRKGTGETLPVNRLLANIALAYAAFGTDGLVAFHKTSLQRLSSELEVQILADGGHISRNGEILCTLLGLLMPLREALQQAHIEVTAAMNAAIERMLPMLRFLCHSDGRLAVFQGVSHTHAAKIKAILDRDVIGGRPLSHAPVSGFVRMAHGHTTLIMDTGQPAHPDQSATAAASPLAMELCDGSHRIVVNCGNRSVDDPEWQRAARLTSAHSTICLGNTDTSTILDGSILKRFFTNRALLLHRGHASADINTDEQGSVIDARHSSYERPFGLDCLRRVFMSADGYDIRGEDQFIEGEATDASMLDPEFRIRFHLHPSVKATMSRDGASIMLVLPNKTGWKFSARGGRLLLEPSISLTDTRSPRPADQIVISGVAGRPDKVQWAFKRIRKTATSTTTSSAEIAPELPLDAG